MDPLSPRVGFSGGKGLGELGERIEPGAASEPRALLGTKVPAVSPVPPEPAGTSPGVGEKPQNVKKLALHSEFPGPRRDLGVISNF